MSLNRARCLVVDDHNLLRFGVRRILESSHNNEFEVVGEASDAAEAYELVGGLKPDLVLMDISMPGLSPFEVARRIRKESPWVKIVFVTMYEDDEYLRKALDVDASGYVVKDTPAPKFLEGLREVLRGRQFVSPTVISTLMSWSSGRLKAVPQLVRLTPRETEIVKLLAEGNSVKEVAVVLNISVKTVEAHKFNLMQKLGFKNRIQLVGYALEHKIIPCPAEGKCPLSRVRSYGCACTS